MMRPMPIVNIWRSTTSYPVGRVVAGDHGLQPFERFLVAISGIQRRGLGNRDAVAQRGVGTVFFPEPVDERQGFLWLQGPP